jgi:hypothetical protein
MLGISKLIVQPVYNLAKKDVFTVHIEYLETGSKAKK